MSERLKSVIDVSRYIVNKCHDMNISISNLKLQKLLYFAQGYSLAITDKPLFDEEIEPWDFGPVVPEAYRHYKMYGANEIPRSETYYNIDFDSDHFLELVEFDDGIFFESEKIIMDAVIGQFGEFTANYLVTLTHNQSPWRQSYGKLDKISKESLCSFFKGYIYNHK